MFIYFLKGFHCFLVLALVFLVLAFNEILSQNVSQVLFIIVFQLLLNIQIIIGIISSLISTTLNIIPHFEYFIILVFNTSLLFIVTKMEDFDSKKENLAYTIGIIKPKTS
jgi:hypothetical protein